MTLVITAPVTGRVVALADVPDPVFAQAVVGPGIAIEPDDDATVATAPVAGSIVKIHPHAVVIGAAGDRGVLTHLGINTVQMSGEGFTVHAADGDTVASGQKLIDWDPQAVRASGRSAIVPIVAMQAEEASLTMLAQAGDHVTAGQPLMEWADPA
ncbi:MAG: PTS glucose transporter subunit IIA [Propionibacteriaceae bacterium]|jgi:PTS system N-acetylglucosamine-specific IIA component|nr:PTS glucose transporter subunit IIA [Propionibacteriaceae bacterium]